MTDLQIVRFSLDATLNAAFATFAAMFLLLAATLIASGRGSAQLGLSPVVSPPRPPGFPSEGSSHCRGLLPRLLSVTWVDACCDVPRLLPEGIVDGRYDDCCD